MQVPVDVQVMCAAGSVFRGDLGQHERVGCTFQQFLAAVLDASREGGDTLLTLCECAGLQRLVQLFKVAKTLNFVSPASKAAAELCRWLLASA